MNIYTSKDQSFLQATKVEMQLVLFYAINGLRPMVSLCKDAKGMATLVLREQELAALYSELIGCNEDAKKTKKKVKKIKEVLKLDDNSSNTK